MTGVKAAVKVHGRVKEIGRVAWDDCASAADYQANPFVSFDFLDCLEQAGCATERTGWVGDFWDLFGPGHALELNNLKSIAEYRHRNGLPITPAWMK